MSLISRRDALRWALTGGASLLVPATLAGTRRPWAQDQNKSGRFFGYEPFTQPLYIPPIAIKRPFGFLKQIGQLTPGEVSVRGPIPPTGNPFDVVHGIAPEFGHCSDWNRFGNQTHESEYQLFTEETIQRFVPGGPDTPVFTYRDGETPPGSGRTPGPTFIVDHQAPVIVRNYNLLTKYRTGVNTTHHDHETSIHLHGSHTPAHADGYPDFYTLAGEGRDYFYPNVTPRMTLHDGRFGRASACEGPFDTTWIHSTLWYHDHAMDVTGFNVSRGLAGFYLVHSERERVLADIGRLPETLRPDGTVAKDDLGGPLDVGLALQDQIFTSEGEIFYDFLDHNGRLGNVFTVNGVVQPKHRVQRRKYRFRFLNGSNSRYFEIRLSNRQKMHIIGTDSWLLPEAIEVRRFNLAPGQRHDVIIDFRGAPSEVFIENIMLQQDGRRGLGIDPSRQRDRLMKFEVIGDTNSTEPQLQDYDVIRGFKGRFDSTLGHGEFAFIPKTQVHTTREFKFGRSNGAWVINNRLFNPRRADAVPGLGIGAERWFLENSSGGWWHPIHTHLEGFQVQRLHGGRIRRERRFNSETFNLEGGFRAEVLIKFRSFTGPFVFHCHAIEHEDMRMMGTIDPTPVDANSGAVDANPPMDGETKIAFRQSGVVQDCQTLEGEERIFFDVAGDVDKLSGRGVGFPDCAFDVSRRGNRG